jgi:hypothetical protein
MWGGEYVTMDDELDVLEREEDLLGLSTFLNYADFARNITDLREKPYYERAKRIAEYSKNWKYLDVLQDAISYFDYERTYSVDYNGYLLNHDQQLAICLEDYYSRSKFFSINHVLCALDLIPVLTETGGGSRMAMFDGNSVETTEKLFGQWCGDLLQISDKVPDGYEIITCCFADIWQRAAYCYAVFGIDNAGYVLDSDEKRFEAIAELFEDKRLLCFIKKEIADLRIFLRAEIVDNHKIIRMPGRLNDFCIKVGEINSW